MKKILVIHCGAEADETSSLTFRGRPAEVRRLGCAGDPYLRYADPAILRRLRRPR